MKCPLMGDVTRVRVKCPLMVDVTRVRVKCPLMVDVTRVRVFYLPLHLWHIIVGFVVLPAGCSLIP